MSTSRLRIGRIVGFGLLAEVATAIIIVAVLAIYNAVVPSSDDVSPQTRIAAILGPGLGVLFTYLAAIKASAPVPDRARLHGVLVGVVTSVLTVPGMFTAPANLLWIYIGAVFLKLAAGWAAGAQVEWRTG